MTFLSYVNIRTFITLLLSVVACYISIEFGLRLDMNMVLFGLAIAFPLATSIQTAFKRRDRALEYLSLFRAAMLAIHYSMQTCKKLNHEKKAESVNILNSTAERLFQYLQFSNGDTLYNFKLDADGIMQFVEQNREFISGRTITRMVRYLKEAMDGANYLVGLTRHRTIKGLRFYSLFFINAYIVIHAPVMVANLEGVIPNWAIYIASAVGALILITLYNLQAEIEFPFDQKGADDVKLEDYKLNI